MLGKIVFAKTLGMNFLDNLSYALLKFDLRNIESCSDSFAHLNVSRVRRIMSKIYLRRTRKL